MHECAVGRIPRAPSFRHDAKCARRKLRLSARSESMSSEVGERVQCVAHNSVAGRARENLSSVAAIARSHSRFRLCSERSRRTRRSAPTHCHRADRAHTTRIHVQHTVYQCVHAAYVPSACTRSSHSMQSQQQQFSCGSNLPHRYCVRGKCPRVAMSSVPYSARATHRGMRCGTSPSGTTE
jgi:hypothetical protein